MEKGVTLNPEELKGPIGRRIPRRRKVALAVGLLLVVGGVAAGIWYLTQEKPLADYELSAAEHLAGRWDDAATRREGGEDQPNLEIAELIFAKCAELGAVAIEIPEGASLDERRRLGDLRSERTQGCLDDSHSDSRPFLVSPGITQLSREELLVWWPHEVLAASDAGGLSEASFKAIAPWRGETDPTKHRAGAVIAYHPKDLPPSLHSVQEIVDRGGWWITSEWLPNQKEHSSGRDNIGERIAVRGAQGFAIEVSAEKPEGPSTLKGRVERRFLYWATPSGSGRLRFELLTSPKHFTREETIQLAEALVSLKSQT